MSVTQSLKSEICHILAITIIFFLRLFFSTTESLKIHYYQLGFPTCLKVSAARVCLDSLLQLLFVKGRLQAQPTFLKRPLAHTLGPGSPSRPGAHWSPPLNEAGHAGSSATPPPSPHLRAEEPGDRWRGLGRQWVALGVTAAGNKAQAATVSPVLLFELYFRSKTTKTFLLRDQAGVGPQIPLLKLKVLKVLRPGSDGPLPCKCRQTLLHPAPLLRPAPVPRILPTR